MSEKQTIIIKNRITEILGTSYPLLQGPMRLLTLGEIAAAVSNSGGFGQIAASGLPGDQLRKEVEKARGLTDRPFGVNVALHRANASEALEIVIEMGIKTITTSGADPSRIMDRLRKAGLKVLHKVSSVRTALKAEAAGVDAVIATGYEAGGHIGRGDVTTFCLVPELCNALKIPVVAAGGVAGAEGLLAALALGAEGIEVGTRFLATEECPVVDVWKQSILKANCESTIVVGEGTAMPVRVLRKETVETVGGILEGEKSIGVDEELMSGATHPCGQAAGLCNEITSITEVFPEMVEKAGLLSFKLYSLFEAGD